MAKLNHISEQTLRLYDKLDLLNPYTISTQNHYRYYSIKQNARLDLIQYMKSLGMTLKDIKHLLDQKDLTLIRHILTQKKEQIDKDLLALRLQKRAIERTLMSYDRYESAPPDGSIVLEYIPERYMYCMDTGINFYDYGIEKYEEMLSSLKHTLVSNGLPSIYFCNAGTILHQEEALKRHFHSTEVFVFVDKDSVASHLLTTIPSQTYLCIYCNQFEKEMDYAALLLDTAKARGYTLKGDYLCEAITDLPIFEGMTRNMYLRLQIPISF